jgi:selenobiotic family peptide radical SAM maturase
MDYDFPICRSVLNHEAGLIFDTVLSGIDQEEPLTKLVAQVAGGWLPPFLPDLFRLEQAVAKVKEVEQVVIAPINCLTLNPTLELIPVEWGDLDEVISHPASLCRPAAGTIILVWRHPEKGHLLVREAEAMDLLALKVLAEELTPDSIAAEQGVGIGVVDAALQQAVVNGLILRPPSAIRRSLAMSIDRAIPSSFLSAEVFTLQWHITQACDLHCKHCYDRTSRGAIPLGKALQLLDNFREFCRSRFVHGQVTFTGGNPFLHPHFPELYQGAVERNLGVAILGNPAPRVQLEQVIAIAKPLFYQVSLEGMEPHNDYIRGSGHFARVMEFLAVLKGLDIYSMVMLTLTRENQEEVLPLAEFLRDKVDLFTFNRLAKVGEGANLKGPEIKSYPDFLLKYHAASRSNPAMGLKDNLFNILALEEAKGDAFGGCAGHGCGAAFNFVAILADGEVHACRKFPSPLGNVFRESFTAIYDSDQAQAYRQGCTACRGCGIRPVCGGCLAVVHGLGLDPLQAKDPYCWIK